MSLKTEFENLKFDVRMQDINLSTKMITPDEVKAELASLQDCSENATKVCIDEPEADEVAMSDESANAVEGNFHAQDVNGQASQPAVQQDSGFSNTSYNPYSSDNN